MKKNLYAKLEEQIMSIDMPEALKKELLKNVASLKRSTLTSSSQVPLAVVKALPSTPFLIWRLPKSA